jgi:L-ascorbate metabolism protein UlaG (beta-lactamase superfamily)
MVITSFGNGFFRLQSGEMTLLLNPANNRTKGDIILRTLSGTSTADLLEGVSDNCVTIAFPGEYEHHEIEVSGFAIPQESTEKFLKTVYKVFFEGMTFVFLGHLSRPLDAQLMEEFSEPDVLILPVGGGHFLEPEVAAKMVKQLEAKVVIPSFTRDSEPFLNALGRKTEPSEKFVFRQKDIDLEKGRPVVLREI